jgi:RHS repeat-associated protein
VYNASGLAYYRHADWLGSSRLASTPSRTLYYDGAYAPYGESYSETGTTDRDFTGQNQDTHPGLYDFMYREYHPVSGRWSSPDPAGLAAVDLSNPQSLNRYAYVMNNPVRFVDPLGLDTGSDCGGPCTDFVYVDRNGCVVRVTYYQETASDGHTYDMPLVDVDCSLNGPGGRPANNATGTISRGTILECAAAGAEGMSLAAKGRVQDSFLGKTFLGNMFSGAYYGVLTLKNTSNAGEAYTTLVVNGARLGLPGGGAVSKGLAGVAQDTILQSAFQNVAKVGSAAAADVAGALKVGYDAATFVYSGVVCAVHW